MKLTIEDMVICLALVLGLSISLFLAIANETWGTHFAPSLIAFFAAISVAALIYRFLGGSGEAQFRMGVLQVTGSAAILLGATWFLGDKIRAQTALYETDSKYRPALEEKQAEVTRLGDANRKLTEQVADLKERDSAETFDRTRYSIGELRKMAPDHDYVSSIRRMVANEDLPFRTTLKDIAARVTLNDAMTATNVYRICTDTQARLFDGLDTQKDRLRMRREAGERDLPAVDMVRGGVITDPAVCSASPARSFDIQITCADALRLFPDRIARCNGLKVAYLPGITTIRGEAVSLGALPPR